MMEAQRLHAQLLCYCIGYGTVHQPGGGLDKPVCIIVGQGHNASHRALCIWQMQGNLQSTHAGAPMLDQLYCHACDKLQLLLSQGLRVCWGMLVRMDTLQAPGIVLSSKHVCNLQASSCWKAAMCKRCIIG